MAFDGNGAYSAPSSSFNPAVDATDIEPTDWNSLLADLVTALSTTICKDGQTTTTARIPFASGISTDTITEKTSTAGVTSDGVLCKDGGLDISGALSLSGQISFPAAQNASSGANVLDDYEENTFTPTLDTTNVGFSSVTYDALRVGTYTKIGRVVFFNLRMVTDAVTVGSASGDVVIAGLPFTAATGLQAVSVGYASAWAGEEPISAAVLGGTATIAIYYRSAVDGNNTATAVADVATGADANDIVISGFYIV